MDGFPIRPEFALSTRGVPLLTLGGWELYLGEKAFCCVTKEIYISFHPPPQRLWPICIDCGGPCGMVDNYLMGPTPQMLSVRGGGLAP